MFLKEYGLVFISNDTKEDGGDADSTKKKPRDDKGTTALVTPEAAAVLERLQGSLGMESHLIKSIKNHASSNDMAL